eukprot:510906-Amphidinium_carterae.2
MPAVRSVRAGSIALFIRACGLWATASRTLHHRGRWHLPQAGAHPIQNIRVCEYLPQRQLI